MKNSLLGLVMLFAVPTGFAADGMASCEKLKRQADRNTCIAEFVKQLSQAKVSPTPAPHVADAAELRRAEVKAQLSRANEVLTAFDSTLSVTTHGVSYNDYGPYIQKAAIELDRYRQGNRSPAEESAGDHLSNALDALKDAREYWAADIDFYSRRDNRLAYSGGLPVGLSGMGRIVSKYDLPKRKSDWLGLHEGVPRSVALTALWQFAAGQVAAARAAFDVPEPRIAGKLEVSTEDPDADLKMQASEVFQKAQCTPSSLVIGKTVQGRHTAGAQCSNGALLVAACISNKCEITEDTAYTDQFFGIIR